MKIVCDSCGAKYSIADEKVQGKVFKIRCKKCSNVIVVKGTADAESAHGAGDEGNLGAGAGAAEWYVVIDGEQVGPVTSNEIDSYFMSGQISADTYAWRDGMGDWQHVVDIPDFAHLAQDVAGPNETTTIADQGAYGDENSYGDDVDATNVMQSPLGMERSDATVSDTPGAMGYGDPYPSDPGYGDDYAYAASSADEDDEGYSGFGSFESGGIGGGMGGELAAAGGDEDDGGGMFAAFDSGADSDFMNFDDAPEASHDHGGANGSNGSNGAGASMGAASDMVGQRNENSVLFSLSSLDQVPGVTGGDESGGAAASSSPGDGPITEGSGLIDIQALASAHKSMGSGGGSTSDGGGIDPFSQGTMAMPALMPMGSHRSNKGLIIALSLAGVAVLALVVVVAVVLGGKDEAEAQPKTIVERVIVEKEVERPVDSDQAAKDEAEAAAAAEEAMKGEPQKVEEEEEEEEAEEEKAVASAKKKTNRRRAPRETKTEEKAAPAPPKKKRGGDGIDDILGQIDKKGQEIDKKQAPSSGGKKSLGRSDVKNTINRYAGRINTCANSHNSAGKKGTVKVKFYIRPNGRVRSPSIVSSGFKGTDVGGCVQKVVGSMKFPSTTASKDVPVTYPFILR